MEKSMAATKPKTMEWTKLLSSHRYTPPPIDGSAASTGHHVTPFQEDAKRILYSSAFRRLQGKTQVHPFPPFDYLRTRLTHTIEVASVGRTIAAAIAGDLTGSDRPTSETAGDIVYAACLAHDVGNPPFGHSGEHAIQTWFESHSDTDVRELASGTSISQNDFVYFDGNAQGFRTLTRVMPFRGEGGLRLTYATLGAFSKYPQTSRFATKKHPKFGVFQDDRAAANTVFRALGLSDFPLSDSTEEQPAYSRHPFAFVVEAADDICYLTTDIEDAFRSQIITFPSAQNLLKDIADGGSYITHYHTIPEKDAQDRIAYLRAGAIGALIDEAILQFHTHLGDIMSGQFNAPLLAAGKYGDAVARIRTAAKEVLYRDRRKLEVEQTGFWVIRGLMDLFGGMALALRRKNGDAESLMPSERGLFELLPEEYRRRLLGASLYGSLLVITDYISGMTDGYALALFQRLTGTKTPT
jgi:dGTPase